MFGGAVIASDNDCVSLPPPLSVSLTVKFFIPAVEGIPLISPVRGFSKRTGGRLPEVIVQATGATAPVAVSVAE
jgi:hypothetical protein